MEPYFKPLLTYSVDGYKIHLLSTDGMYVEKGMRYAESGLWGFRYKAGKYSFLGDLAAFGQDNYEEIYPIIKADFEKNKDRYLTKSISHKSYWEAIEEDLIDIENFEDYLDVRDYAESYYSYFLAKYSYEQTGNFRYVMEIVANFVHNDDDILLDLEHQKELMDEYFRKLNYHLAHVYSIAPEMIVCATEGYRFTHYGGTSFAFLDKDAETVYILEYHKQQGID
jgi:hypothetical protein